MYRLNAMEEMISPVPMGRTNGLYFVQDYLSNLQGKSNAVTG